MKKELNSQIREELEIWKDVAGYEGLYQVSNLGNVMSLPRKKMSGVRVGLLTPKRITNRYFQVVLFKEGKGKSLTVHRLVAIAFIPNPGNKPEVNHINGVKDDNRLSNLEWCTRSENMLHLHHVLGLSNKGVLTQLQLQKP